MFFDLSSIAAIGALSMLLIHMTVHVGHLRLLKETGASRLLVALAVVSSGSVVALGGYYLIGVSPVLIVWIGGFFALSVAIELLLNRYSARSVTPRSVE